MINEKYFAKDDIIHVETTGTTMTTYDVDVTTEIMTGVTDRISLILAIEAYNETHKLPYNKRVRYSIAVSNNYISVLKAYKLSETELAIIGWDQNGYPGITYDNKGNVDQAMAGISTHVVKIDNINDVVIGKYDKTQIGNVFTYKTVDEIGEKELNSKLTKVLDDMIALISAGQYRSAFNKFNYEFNRQGFNDYTYEHKNVAYTTYVRLWVKYILMLKDIITDSINPGRIEYSEDNYSKAHNRFEFVNNLDTDLEPLLYYLYRESYGTPQYENEKESRLQAIKEHTFTNEELETFKSIIDYDNLKLDNNGMPYWEATESISRP